MVGGKNLGLGCNDCFYYDVPGLCLCTIIYKWTEVTVIEARCYSGHLPNGSDIAVLHLH